MLYRTGPMSPIYVAKFSKFGYHKDFWKLSDRLNNKRDIKIFRDKSDENGPSGSKKVATYIFVPEKTFIYHEMTESGQTYKFREYQTDIAIRPIDMIAINKHLYVISPDRLYRFVVNEDKLKKEEELADFKTINKYKKIALTQGKIFLFVQRSDSGRGYEVYANANFTTK